MEAPDKIFLAFDHGFVAQSSNIKEDINGNSIFLSQYVPIEYVRKDALLEWAKENEKRLGDLLTINNPSLVIGGKLYAYQEFIEKIESL